MQVIDGKHYVEGGPKCEGWQNYEGTHVPMSWADCDNGKNAIFDSPEARRQQKLIIIKCPACHGTGVKPVESWTADEYAEWLRQGFKLTDKSIKKIYQQAVSKAFQSVFYGDTELTHALQAAVIAIEESK